MKEITLTLSKSSINSAIKQLERYRNAVNRKIDNAMHRIAEDIAKRAAEIYAEAKLPEFYFPGWDEQPTIKVNKLETGNGYEVVVSGQQVGFLEFGTGAFSDSQHPYTGEVTFPVFPGSYSDTVGSGSYLRWVTAHGDDNEYPYNREPTRALYKAVTEMKPLIETYLRKEFSNGKP